MYAYLCEHLYTATILHIHMCVYLCMCANKYMQQVQVQFAATRMYVWPKYLWVSDTISYTLRPLSPITVSQYFCSRFQASPCGIVIVNPLLAHGSFQ